MSEDPLQSLPREVVVRQRVHDWIRETAPLAAKLNLTPEHVDDLVARLAQEFLQVQIPSAEVLARAIMGPHHPVPATSPHTLESLREIRWKASDRNHQNGAMASAQAVIRELTTRPKEAR